MGITSLMMPWMSMTGRCCLEKRRRGRGCWLRGRVTHGARSVSHKAACLVEEVRVKKWKQLAAEGTVLTCAPPSVVCTECTSRKHMCFLPELEKEWVMMKSASKRKQEEDDKLRALGSKESGGATVEGAEEVPKKRSRMQELWAREKSVLQVREKKKGQGKIVEALEYIGKGLPALVQVVNDLNRHLATITNYVDQYEWNLEDRESKEDEDEESKEDWGSGDDEVAHGSGSSKKIKIKMKTIFYSYLRLH